ncbi:FIST signal transduction protein [Butyrivibrio proteoclasticus]|uniref:FIST signal transduction protein n=1 Tax=Butyrivibrio proteoclasticus TaxID=43305 RepID=UPI00047E322E|nr:FIST N-terminal domain-containing protein [Butyrivibrio proteoclasticus]
MKIYYGKSESGSVSEAVKGLSSPKLIIMTSHADKFDANVEALEKLYPGVPCIGCVGMGYDTTVVENGVSITAFCDGVSVAVGILDNVSTMPARYISRLIKDIESVHPGKENTAIIDFCAGNDAAVLTTMSTLIDKYNLQVMGATGDAGKVSINGKIYPDAMVYAVIKNEGGRVRSYKENIYVPRDNKQLIASKTDKSKYYLGELNGRPAKQFYMELTGCSESGIVNQTFKNPFGKMVGDDICIASLKDVSGNGLILYRQINDSDILTLLEMRDPMEIAESTVSKIKNDFSHISGIFSVNCIFRYLVLKERGELNSYLGKIATLGTSCGLVGFGEHFNTQFVNQTMTCVVFE